MSINGLIHITKLKSVLMKFKFLLPVMLLWSSLCTGQTQNTFLLKGNVKNFDKSFFEVIVNGFFNTSTIAIKVDKKGNFSKNCAIDGVQNIYIEVGDDYKSLFAAPGDTLILNWFNSSEDESFAISSPNKNRVQELSAKLKLSEATDKSFRELNEKLYDKGLADSTKFKMINDFYQAEIQFLSKFPPTTYSFKIFGDTYFKYASLLQRLKLSSKYSLSKVPGMEHTPMSFMDHTFLSEQLFKQSENYRDFIYNQVRFSAPFTAFMQETNKTTPSNFTAGYYHSGFAFLPITSVRDWFITKTIMDGFGHHQFNDVKKVYEDFLLTCETPAYIDTLKTFYANIEKLAPGKPAPQFTLKDDSGKLVALKDLKGKVVFIDFWGVYCGPCIGDIKENGAKFHEKYKGKEVVFVNICVDVAEKEWKKAIKDLKLDGRNLLAEGWTNNQVCKDYAINGIPHYVLIDHKGDIITSNAPGMWELVGEAENILDKALTAIKNN